MSEEPIEGRILDDDEVKNMKYKENLSSLQESINESRRKNFQQMRAENFYKIMNKGMVDRNNPLNFLRTDV